MFTGIIEEVGTILATTPFENGRAFTIAASRVRDDLGPGDSIAIDGACHTVTRIVPDGFAVQSVVTTLQRTALGGYEAGRPVNLERAVVMGARLGGHLLQGHVDAVGDVLAIEPAGDHVLIDVTLPAIVADVTILHGSIGLNGISLTVNALPAPDRVQVSIIPHTWDVTALRALRVGSAVNLEGDLIGKYVRHLLHRDPTSPP